MSEPPAGTPPPDHPAEQPAEPELRCWRCESPHDRFQEYCLECGARLAPREAGAGWRREIWTRDSPFWFWATFLALLLIALVAGAIVLAATNDDDDSSAQTNPGGGPTTSQITEIPTSPVTTSPLPPELTIPPTTTTAQPPTTAPTTAPTTTAATTTAPTTTGGTAGGQIISWPAGKSGYTIVLTSLAENQGRSAAEARAREAIQDGLDEVGVLNSSDYSSLNAGYWVVFTGVYDTEAQAQADLPGVRQRGYPIAYIRQITP